MRTAVTTVTRRIQVADDPMYVTAAQVKRRFGDVSDMWLWRALRFHSFPQPVRFGGRTSARHWKLSDVEAWERERAKRSAKWSASPDATPGRQG